MEVKCSLSLPQTLVIDTCNIATCFAVDLRAIQDVWIVGDQFLREVYHSYTALKEAADRSQPRRHRPYLLDYYKVSSHVMGTTNGIRSTAARIQNCIIRQINACKTMPRMVIIIPDNDIIKHNSISFYDYGAKKMCEMIVSWLVNNINKAITGRREDMKHLKPGSVMQGEPKNDVSTEER